MSKPVEVAKAAAVLRVFPSGAVQRQPRDYLIALDLTPSPADGDAGIESARRIAERVLQGVSSTTTATDHPRVRDLVHVTKPGKDGVARTRVSGVEAEVLCAGPPPPELLAAIRTELGAQGYRVTLFQRRACSEPGCTVDAALDAGRQEQRPRGWFSDVTCERHNFRSCVHCDAVLTLQSSNFAGPAPSVACPACNAILVEWGGSKLWEVELVRTASLPRPQ